MISVSGTSVSHLTESEPKLTRYQGYTDTCRECKMWCAMWGAIVAAALALLAPPMLAKSGRSQAPSGSMVDSDRGVRIQSDLE